MEGVGGDGASGSIVSSSERMQPTLHTSMAVVYFCSKISSGARYHRVTTCVVIWRETGGHAGRLEDDA